MMCMYGELTLSANCFTDVIRPITTEGHMSRKMVAKVLRADAKQYTSPEAFLKRNWHFFFQLSIPLDDADNELFQPLAVVDIIRDDIMASSVDRLDEIPTDQWKAARLKEELIDIVDKICETEYETLTQGELDCLKNQKIVNGMLHHWLRQATVGGLAGPGMPDTMALLERETSLRRIHAAKVYAKQRKNRLDSHHSQSG